MILAGITLFNPEIGRLEENISSIYNQVDAIVCIDNHSDNIDEIENLLKNHWPDVKLLKNDKNEGIAKALNQLFDFSKKNGHDYVLTLDQDSVCPNNMIEEYMKYINYERLGSICPQCVDRNFEHYEISEEIREVDKCITSASLVPVKVWEDVGGFYEELFIDFVDHDFCAKLKEKNYKILQIGTVKLLHELGNGKRYNIFGIQFTALNHSSIRKYYMVRNWLFYMYIHESVIDIKAEKKSYHLFFLKTFLFENNKIDKMKQMLRGRKDGLNMIKEKKWKRNIS